jgi:hypothetical protein
MDQCQKDKQLQQSRFAFPRHPERIWLTNNEAPVTDVKSADFRCYTSETGATASTISVAAGSTIGFTANGPMYHAGVSKQSTDSQTRVLIAIVKGVQRLHGQSSIWQDRGQLGRFRCRLVQG